MLMTQHHINLTANDSANVQVSEEALVNSAHFSENDYSFEYKSSPRHPVQWLVHGDQRISKKIIVNIEFEFIEIKFNIVQRE